MYISMGKRKRSNREVAQTGVIDRISKLHDDIICSILSSLPIRDAVKTSVLSTRWRQLWTYKHTLIFDSQSLLGKDMLDVYSEKLSTKLQLELLSKRTRKFIHLVSTFLQHHQGIGVQIFEVHFPMSMNHARHIDRWVSFAVASGTSELHLNFKRLLVPEILYDFPCQLLSCCKGPPLKRLYLASCTLRPPPNFSGFGSLKDLYLQQVPVTEMDMLNVLCSCSGLEWLTLRDCNGLVNLKITHQSLKYLFVTCCENLNRIDMYAVNLATFEYNGRKISIRAKDTQITRASIFLRIPNCCASDYFLTILPCNFPWVETLYFHFLIDPFQDEFLRQSSLEFTYLKHLVFFVSSWKDDIFWMTSLLKAAPSLEKLEVHIFKESLSITQAMIRLSQPSHDPHTVGIDECNGDINISCLQTVKISGFTGKMYQMKLAAFLLKHAASLRLMILDPYRKWYTWNGTWDSDIPSILKHRHLRKKIARRLVGKVPSNVQIVIL